MVASPERVVRRFLARARGKHYRYTDRELKRYNDPEVNEQSMRENGGYSVYRIEIVPIRDIKVPKVWKPSRFEKSKARLEKGLPTDPIRAVKQGGKWVIEDGIHRTNASIALGYTHIPVLTSEWIETPEAYEAPPEEKPQLAVGDWVKLNEPSYNGKVYGWVDEKLGPRRIQGIRRYWYSLILVGPDSNEDYDFGDYGDIEFEPVRPPSWAAANKEHMVEKFGW